MKIAIHDISVARSIDLNSLILRVEYTPENGDTTIDYGTYLVRENSYYPALDEYEAEYYALQERVETR